MNIDLIIAVIPAKAGIPLDASVSGDVRSGAEFGTGKAGPRLSPG
jgi:hypothetical protein